MPYRARHRRSGDVAVGLGSGDIAPALGENRTVVFCRFLAVATLLIGVIGFISAPSNEYSGPGVSIVVVLSLTTVPVSVWLVVTGWPSRRQLWCFLIYADLSISVGLLLKDDHLSAISGTALFAVVTVLAVVSTEFFVCAIHLTYSVLVLAGLVVRELAYGSAAGWVVAAHCITMMLMFLSPLLVLVHVVELRARSREALIDPLTSLANRRGFDAAIGKLALRVHGTPLLLVVGIVMLDVDGFKKINDGRGHHQGDAVLITLATYLRVHAPSSYCVARLGGDEFTCLFVGDHSQVEEACRRLVGAVTGTVLLRGFTVTTGTATSSVGPVGDALRAAVHAAMVDADAAMYRSKNMRRA